MRKLSAFAFAALLTVAAGLDVSAAGKKKKAEDEGIDKKRFEAYLQGRVAKIKDAHKVRMEFFTKEGETWKTFWEKVRDERQVFEVRVTRQTLDLFESLASLDPKDHPTTIANFERMHSDIMRSFEAQQREKMQAFFAEREARWKEFAAEQEKERTDFMAEAQSGWQDNKDQLASAVGAGEEPEDRPKSSGQRKATPPQRRPQNSPFASDTWR